MPRFFFHISNKDLEAEDCEGVDLPDLHAAMKHALNAFRQLGIRSSDALGLEFTIADKSGHPLLRVPVPDWQHQPLSPSTEPLARAWRSPPGTASGHLH